MAEFDFLGFLPYDDALIEADLQGVSPFETDSLAKTAIQEMIARM
jgi:CO dehydrogenase maturation factor